MMLGKCGVSFTTKIQKSSKEGRVWFNREEMHRIVSSALEKAEK
jgi:hypothetical protein